MLEKSIVRFFKSTGTGYVPLDWAMFTHGFYKQQKDFHVPIAVWVDGLAVKPFQLLYKEGKIYQVAKVNTVGTWAGLDVVEIKGLMGIVRDFKPATYILQDVVIYNDVLYVCKKEGFHVAWNPDNWVVATDRVELTTITHYKESDEPKGEQVISNGMLVSLLTAGPVEVGPPVPPPPKPKFKSVTFIGNSVQPQNTKQKLLEGVLASFDHIAGITVVGHVVNASGAIVSNFNCDIVNRDVFETRIKPKTEVIILPGQIVGYTVISATEFEDKEELVGPNVELGKRLFNASGLVLTEQGDVPPYMNITMQVRDQVTSIFRAFPAIKGNPTKRVVAISGQVGNAIPKLLCTAYIMEDTGSGIRVKKVWPEKEVWPTAESGSYNFIIPGSMELLNGNEFPAFYVRQPNSDPMYVDDLCPFGDEPGEGVASGAAPVLGGMVATTQISTIRANPNVKDIDTLAQAFTFIPFAELTPAAIDRAVDHIEFGTLREDVFMGRFYNPTTGELSSNQFNMRVMQENGVSKLYPSPPPMIVPAGLVPAIFIQAPGQVPVSVYGGTSKGIYESNLDYEGWIESNTMPSIVVNYVAPPAPLEGTMLAARTFVRTDGDFTYPNSSVQAYERSFAGKITPDVAEF